jgi:hypothetical protein
VRVTAENPERQPQALLHLIKELHFNLPSTWGYCANNSGNIHEAGP